MLQMARRVLLLVSTITFFVLYAFYLNGTLRSVINININININGNSSSGPDFSETVRKKLQERKQIKNAVNEQREPQYCANQREGYYIQFLDVSLSGPGLLHRKEDFKAFIKFAFNTGRILVDNVPELTSRHESLTRQSETSGHNQSSRSFSNLPMSFFYDLENVLMESKFGNGQSAKCVLKVVTKVPEEFHSFVRVDYGARGKDNYKGNILMTLGRETPSLNQPYRLIINDGEGLRVSPWIQKLAKAITRTYFQPIRNDHDYYVIHLRGRDRACLLNARENFVINKLRRMKVSLSENAYLMTDMSLEHPVVSSVREGFGKSLISAENVEIFKKYPFNVNNYLVFAVELGLAQLAKGFVDTYPGHYVGQNLKGTLYDHSYFFHPCQEKPESAKFLFLSALGW